jgi:hypothetical protein
LGFGFLKQTTKNVKVVSREEKKKRSWLVGVLDTEREQCIRE